MRRPALPPYLQEGLVLSYAKREAARFHALAAITAVTFAASLTWPYEIFSVVALLSGCSAYYFFPLTEARVRLGASQYALFIDGFGLIDWRGIGDVSLATYSIRTLEVHELQIKLQHPLTSVLLTDWRRLPLWRLLMRLPWTMGYDNIVRVNLQPFGPPPLEVQTVISRMWRYYR